MTSIETTVSGHDDNQLIPIITTEHKTLKFHEENLARLLDREILEDIPIAIVSIAGKKRLGKSLFLNLLLHYLKKRGWGSDTEDWLTGWNSSIHDGFVARGGENPVTTGIIAWGEPIFVHSPARNKDIAIILLDTEGTFDTANRDVNVDIFAMSTLSSSLQIFNIDKQITSDDLVYLKYFTKQARIAATNQSMTDVDSGRSSLTNQSRFQNLVFLIRNWFNSDRSYGIEGGREYLHQELAKFEDNNDHGHVVDGRHPIYGAFQNVSCFLMPEPDEKVRYRGENGPPLNVEDLGKKFISFTTAFAREYLHPDKLPTKLMKAKYLLEFLKQCGTRIEEGCLPKLKDIDELMAQHVIQKAKEIATDTFLSAMEKFIEDVERPNWKSFDDAVKKQKQLVTDNFRSEVRLYVSEDTLEEEVTKILQTLDEKIGNELIKKMQKKIIPYAKQEAVDHFFSTAKTEIQGMENLIWENFDETIDTQTTRMQEKFLNAVLRSDTNVNVENDKVDLENKLTKEAGGRLLNLMRQERKSYVKDASKNSLDEAKEQLEEYSFDTWFPLPYFGTKTIRKQCTKDFKTLVEKDERDSKVVKDIVDDFETLAKDVAQSADFTILGRYASSTVFGVSVAFFCVSFPPAAPVVAVAALGTGTGLASFGGAMAAPKLLGYSIKAWEYVSQKFSQMSDRQKKD